MLSALALIVVGLTLLACSNLLLSAALLFMYRQWVAAALACERFEAEAKRHASVADFYRVKSTVTWQAAEA